VRRASTPTTSPSLRILERAIARPGETIQNGVLVGALISATDPPRAVIVLADYRPHALEYTGRDHVAEPASLVEFRSEPCSVRRGRHVVTLPRRVEEGFLRKGQLRLITVDLAP